MIDPGIKLYPPQISGGIPAFCQRQDKPHVELQVPFVMNKSVGWVDIERTYGDDNILFGGIFHVQIKDLENNQIKFSIDSWEYDKENGIAIFGIPQKDAKEKLIVGNFYKIQIAYNNIEFNKESSIPDIKTKTIGYFSTVGIAKYTAEPNIYIQDFAFQNNIVKAGQEIIGVYDQKNGDFTEKIYSYNFAIYQRIEAQENDTVDYKLIYQTEELIHNHENNEGFEETYDSWLLPFELSNTSNDNETIQYYIVYSVITANGIQKSTDFYPIAFDEKIDQNMGNIFLINDKENGFVELEFIAKKAIKNQGDINSVSIYRTTIKQYYDNKQLWQHVHEFFLPKDIEFKQYLWRDYTVEAGQNYKYKIVIKDKAIHSNEILVDFEHIYLYDGERQLKIKYNPKISSFKETILESKTNTLGGKYPYFFRNGQVQYKEFPISGLISYQMDEMELFLKNKDMGLDNVNDLSRPYTIESGTSAWEYYQKDNYDPFTYLSYVDNERKNSNYNVISNSKQRAASLVDYNIYAEKVFKFKVLEFLNNGKPKLFKSPIEGNCLVRLMNSSLTPNDQLGRMLHTFNTTATEIDECSLEKMSQYGIVNLVGDKIDVVRTVVEYMPYHLDDDTPDDSAFYYYFPPGQNHVKKLVIKLSNPIDNKLGQNKGYTIFLKPLGQENGKSYENIITQVYEISPTVPLESIWIKEFPSSVDKILLTYQYVGNYASISQE